MEKIKILIVDDHPLMREALGITLNSEDDLEVIAQFGTAEDALEALQEITPDVIMMDLALPGMSGLDAIQKIVERDPHAKVLVNSAWRMKIGFWQLFALGRWDTIPKLRHANIYW